MSVYDGMMKGLSEALEHAEGKRTLRTEKLYVEPLHTYSAEEIKKIRSDLGMTQVLFADVLGVSAKTVEAWEKGTNHPTGSACCLLDILSSGCIKDVPFIKSERAAV